MNQKDERSKEIIRALVAEFISRESNRTSLITITDIMMEERGARAKILFTVLPEDQENAVLDFMTRRLTDLRDYVSGKARMMRIPFFEVAIDKGEKNRQKIDAIESNL